MRRAARTDANQSKIVDALRKVGASVHITSSLGGGFPDLVVGLNGKTTLLEVKTSTGTLTEPEQKFFDEWRGEAYIVRTVEEAYNVCGLWIEE